MSVPAPTAVMAAQEAATLPSPHSDNEYDLTSAQLSAYPDERGPVVSHNPLSDENMREGADRKHVEAPRNTDGKICCTMDGCNGITFDRKCEWTKHMDKHERPYVCDAIGCEKLRGFTYSGGLLRHQREVHKKHGGPKELLMCPFPYCKRNSGSGFTRKENLHEHIRRVHRAAPPEPNNDEQVSQQQQQQQQQAAPEAPLTPHTSQAQPPQDASQDPLVQLQLSVQQPTGHPNKSRKRRASHQHVEDQVPAIAVDQAELQALRDENARIRADLNAQHERIVELEGLVQLMTSQQDTQHHIR